MCMSFAHVCACMNVYVCMYLHIHVFVCGCAHYITQGKWLHLRFHLIHLLIMQSYKDLICNQCVHCKASVCTCMCACCFLYMCVRVRVHMYLCM